MVETEQNQVPSKEVQERCNNWVESQRDVTYLESHGTNKRKLSEDSEDYVTDSEFDSVSECGAKKRRAGLQIKKEKLRLVCEWTECVFESNHVERFLRHVAEHIPRETRRCKENETEVFACQWGDCNYETAQSEEITRHVNYHAYHTKLKCIGSNIRDRIKLPRCRRDTDWKNIVDLPPPHLCRWMECLRIVTNYQMFLFHVAAHVNDGPRGHKVEGGVQCKWTGCSNVFVSLHKLKDHMKCHTKEKTVACPDCGSTFASNTKFLWHCKRQIPLDVQGFQCTHCNKFYPTEGILRDHMRSHVYNYKCTLCEMTCESPTSLAKHVRYRHVSTRSFHCQLCTHSAKSQQDLDSHMTVHTNGPNFFCHFEGCLYNCKGAYTLDRHIERVHNQRIRWYCCHECPVKYRKSHWLTKHLMAAHQLQLPNGHKRFQYTQDEDGCYRLQMVRYEAVEDDNYSVNQECTTQNKQFEIRLKTDAPIPQIEILEVNKENEDESSSVSGLSDGKSGTEVIEANSMSGAPNIIISIDETDAEGNIINTKIIETRERTELPISEGSPIIIT